MKTPAILIFILLVILLLAVYYVGAASDTLVFAKVGQQIGYLLTGRDSSGRFANATQTVTMQP